MRSKLFPGTLLVPLSMLVIVVTGELEYYQDEVADSTNAETLKKLVRYLESHHQVHHTRLPPHQSPLSHKEQLLGLAREKERNIFEALSEKPSIIDVLEKRNLKQLNYEQQAQQKLLKNYAGRDEGSYYDSGSVHFPTRFEEYPKDSFIDNKLSSHNMNYQTFDRQYPVLPAPTNRQHHEDHQERGMKEELFLDFQKEHDMNEGEGQPNRNQFDEMIEPKEYTYVFDEPDTYEEQPFAVKPNDPRYYEDTPPSKVVGTRENPDDYAAMQHIQEARNEESSGNKEVVPKLAKLRMTERPNKFKEADEGMAEHPNKFEEADEGMLPEPHRRAEQDPHSHPVGHKVNADIYFIAVVAGCSAAAMFILVLISLTWCRLQRGAKAAADVEYPAYGVTGPNKDTSPSGDRRLAQSAQMYHYQHQKQQIIAMENRTAAARDPGSVSEAESDEENEEGDYTVYECPGLAPTGEMEVKNPLFHDDPTPATPAQTSQEGDHTMSSSQSIK